MAALQRLTTFISNIDLDDDTKAGGKRDLRRSGYGKVHPIISRVDPLDNAADAHTAFEDRQIIGKALLVVE